MKKLYIKIVPVILFFITALQCYASTDTLIAAGASWKYLDNGTNQGTSWTATSFNDASWVSGNAELGYGDGDEATTVSYGGNATNKYVTTYFRKSFTVSNPSDYISMNLDIVRDDGAIVYINGSEIYRGNMPSGTTSYTTLASVALGVPDESTWYSSSFSTSYLVSGTNEVAVEIHQANVTSSDISFNFRLTGTTTASITRGPYLQVVTPTSIIVRWQTDVATDSKVRCGSSTSNYTMTFSDATSATDHEVQLTGLIANTKYYYTIETSTYQIQGDASNYFQTSPATGSTTPVRIWAIGDFGNNSSGQTAVRDAYKTYTGSTYTNLWLWLGDNAYSSGTDAQYQSYVFDIYGEQFKTMPLYPSPGNHDYANVGYESATALTTNFPYYDNFTMPKVAEAGGVASWSEKYYSFDYANIHFISLDSYGALNNSGSAMYTWLASDLSQNTQDWTIVYFHHAPYTMGSHNSDTETELLDMRQNIIPLLESYHVDLVLSGHSHVNERSYLIKGHYGLSSTFNSSMLVSSGSGSPSSPYVKTSPYNGTVYAVCGTSGQLSTTSQSGFPMPCMYFSNKANNCSLVLDIDGDTLVCKYLASDQSILDEFEIQKSSSVALPVQWLSFNATAAGSSVELEWSTVCELNNDYFSIERSKDGTGFEEIAQVKGSGDNVQFHQYNTIDKNPFPGTSFYRLKQVDFDKHNSYSEVVAVNINEHNFIKIIPNPVVNKLDIVFNADSKMSCTILITDTKGTEVYSCDVQGEKGSNTYKVNIANLDNGVYIVKVLSRTGTAYTARFVKVSHEQ